jgi:hypothetical protein
VGNRAEQRPAQVLGFGHFVGFIQDGLVHAFDSDTIAGFEFDAGGGLSAKNLS